MAALVLLVSFLSSSWNSGTLAAPSLAMHQAITSRTAYVTGVGLDASECSCPNTRSLLGIIWSCLTTVVMCTWVAAHPNLPPPGEARWRTILRRLKLMFWALIGPELILGWSIRQWVTARKIATENASRGWSQIHGFLFVMGGFSLTKGEEDLGTLSYDSFKDLCKTGDIDFPLIAREEIEDKSKGDPLSKGLVILQTLWFIVQCIGRTAQGLDLTELEIVTLAFCSLNATVYCFWWDKPLDVERRIPVHLKSGSTYRPDSKSEEVDEIREVDRTSVEAPVAVNPDVPPETDNDNPNQPIIVVSRDCVRIKEVDRTSVKAPVAVNPNVPQKMVNEKSHHLIIVASQGRVRSSVQNGIESVGRIFRRLFSKLCDTIRNDLDTYNVLFLIFFIWPIGRPIYMICKCIFTITEVYILDNISAILGSGKSEHIVPGVRRVDTFYSPKLESDDDLTMSMLFSLFGTIFGALHCIAWKFNFPTQTERLLWRALSLLITCIPLTLFIYIPFTSYKTGEDGEFRSTARNSFVAALEGFYLVMLVFLLACYIPLRLILIFESFILLRSVSPSVLLDINWADFVPHL